MMPMAAASLNGKPNRAAQIVAAKMPIWAAAANSIMYGFRRSGAKSHMAPMPMKISTGNNSLAMPILYSTVRKPGSPPPVGTTAK